MSSDKQIWIGFDLGGTKMLSVAYDDQWGECGRRRRKTRGRDGSDNGVSRIISTIERLIEENELGDRTIAGIGIGCPGPIDMNRGRILTTPNLGWDDVDVGDAIAKTFDVPVAVMNDVDAGVYGEYRFGAAQGARCVVGIFPGTGVGGGCVYQGHILGGSGISCMEIGHTKISSGMRTSGGMAGTVEALASRLAIAAEAAKAAQRGDAPALYKDAGTDIAEIRSGAIADSIKKGDKSVERLVKDAASVIGLAVANSMHMLAPEVFILGGGLVEAMEDLFVKAVSESAREAVMPVYRDRFEVRAARLGDDAGVKGAAAWAKQKIAETGSSGDS